MKFKLKPSLIVRPVAIELVQSCPTTASSTFHAPASCCGGASAGSSSFTSSFTGDDAGAAAIWTSASRSMMLFSTHDQCSANSRVAGWIVANESFWAMARSL